MTEQILLVGVARVVRHNAWMHNIYMKEVFMRGVRDACGSEYPKRDKNVPRGDRR